MESRVKKLEKMMPPPRKESDGLDRLSVPELKELERYVIKQDAGESFTDAEQERINTIMAKTKSS